MKTKIPDGRVGPASKLTPEQENGVSLLRHDPDLCEEMDPERFREARAELIVKVKELDPGEWEDVGQAPAEFPHLGFLILEGVLIREAELCGRESCELLGPGNLIRPWQSPVRTAGFPVGDDWIVLETVRMAVLDREFAIRAHRYPEVGAGLLARQVDRTRWLEFNLAVAQIPRIDLRLLFVFSYLAEMWGRVNSAGIEIPIHLTHQQLAALVGARRPSVTTALGALSDDGLISREGNGFWEVKREFADFSLILTEYKSMNGDSPS